MSYVHAIGPGLALAGDRAWVERALAAPGGLAMLAPARQAFLQRAVAALDLLQLVELAESSRDGITLYRLWLAEHGQNAQSFAAWFNLGIQHYHAADLTAAAAALERALTAKPDFHAATLTLGMVQEAAGNREAAVDRWRQALPPAAERLALHNQIGRVLEGMGDIAQAAQELRASLLIEPDQPDVLQHLIHIRQRMAAWPPLQLDVPGVDPDTAAANCGPLAALALFDDPGQQRRIAADWIARKLPGPGQRLAPLQGYRHDRIRIGYLSSDFCRHAMSFLIAEVLERHDRSSFEVFGYCASPEDGSDIRERVVAAMDHHVRIAAITDAEAAARIRADEIDILIDLNGLTKGSRLGILRWKPAPVQMTYLGYIGPVPLPELDWMLCDAVTVPPEIEADYAPPPLRIDGCYQANDSRPPVLPDVSRASEGLPASPFVYCCVSHHYKITADVFAAWCRIAREVPGSVLWLIDDNPQSRSALSARWQAFGLDPGRLIFAPRVDPDRYRARLALADLFLDTTPYNAGTIASDALRMGLPLITLRGRAFAARMAASLLTRIGLPECIAATMEDYVQLGVAIGRDPVRHAALKRHLAGDAWHQTLGDCASFTRNLETTLRTVRLTPP